MISRNWRRSPPTMWRIIAFCLTVMALFLGAFLWLAWDWNVSELYEPTSAEQAQEVLYEHWDDFEEAVRIMCGLPQLERIVRLSSSDYFVQVSSESGGALNFEAKTPWYSLSPLWQNNYDGVKDLHAGYSLQQILDLYNIPRSSFDSLCQFLNFQRFFYVERFPNTTNIEFALSKPPGFVWTVSGLATSCNGASEGTSHRADSTIVLGKGWYWFLRRD